jgi:hypothetical protein
MRSLFKKEKHMRAFFNLFLSLVLPVTGLFIVLATGYFTLDYDLGNAFKLGTLAGFISGILFSTVMATVLFFMRKARVAHITKNDPHSAITHPSENGSVDKQFILLMDKVMAFDVLIQSIIDQKLGEVGKGDKRKGTITLQTPEQNIDIIVKTLTEHTSQVHIKAGKYSEPLKQIINYTKTKEYSFLQY